MKISERGQITIPRELREKFGFLPDTEIEFVVRGNTLQLVRSVKERRSEVDRIYGARSLQASTDELMKLLRG